MIRFILAQNPLSVDGGGIYGSFLQYSLFFALLGSALLVFFYFWRKGKLDMDEAPKMQMMNEDEYPKRKPHE